MKREPAVYKQIELIFIDNYKGDSVFLTDDDVAERLEPGLKKLPKAYIATLDYVKRNTPVARDSLERENYLMISRAPAGKRGVMGRKLAKPEDLPYITQELTRRMSRVNGAHRSINRAKVQFEKLLPGPDFKKQIEQVEQPV